MELSIASVWLPWTSLGTSGLTPTSCTQCQVLARVVQAVLWALVALAALPAALMLAWAVRAVLRALEALPEALMWKQPGALLVAVGLRALVHRMALLAWPTREQGLGLPTAALVIFAGSMIEGRLRESRGLSQWPWHLLSNPAGPARRLRAGDKLQTRASLRRCHREDQEHKLLGIGGFEGTLPSLVVRPRATRISVSWSH
jgi:hypothetical protein